MMMLVGANYFLYPAVCRKVSLKVRYVANTLISKVNGKWASFEMII